MVVLLTRSHGRVDRGGLVLGGFLLLCIVFVVFLPSIFEEMRRSGESPSRLGERRNGDGGSVADEVLLAMEKFNEMDAHFKEHFDRILFDLSSNRSSLDVLVLSFVHHEKKQKEIMLRHHITSRTETAKHHLFEKLTSNKTSSDRRLVHLLLKTLSSDRARDLEEFLIDFIDSPTSHSSADLEEKMEFYEEEVLKIRNLVAERTKEIDRLWSTQKKELTPGLTPKCQLDADNAGVLFGCYRDRFVRHRECDCEYTPERDQRLVLCVAVGCIAFGLALLQLSRRCDQGHRRGSKIPLVYPDFMLPKEGFGPKHLYHIPPSAIPILRPPPSIVRFSANFSDALTSQTASDPIDNHIGSRRALAGQRVPMSRLIAYPCFFVFIYAFMHYVILNRPGPDIPKGAKFCFGDRDASCYFSRSLDSFEKNQAEFNSKLARYAAGQNQTGASFEEILDTMEAEEKELAAEYSVRNRTEEIWLLLDKYSSSSDDKIARQLILEDLGRERTVAFDLFLSDFLDSSTADSLAKLQAIEESFKSRTASVCPRGSSEYLRITGTPGIRPECMLEDSSVEGILSLYKEMYHQPEKTNFHRCSHRALPIRISILQSLCLMAGIATGLVLGSFVGPLSDFIAERCERCNKAESTPSTPIFEASTFVFPKTEASFSADLKQTHRFTVYLT